MPSSLSCLHDKELNSLFFTNPCIYYKTVIQLKKNKPNSRLLPSLIKKLDCAGWAVYCNNGPSWHMSIFSCQCPDSGGAGARANRLWWALKLGWLAGILPCQRESPRVQLPQELKGEVWSGGKLPPRQGEEVIISSCVTTTRWTRVDREVRDLVPSIEQRGNPSYHIWDNHFPPEPVLADRNDIMFEAAAVWRFKLCSHPNTIKTANVNNKTAQASRSHRSWSLCAARADPPCCVSAGTTVSAVGK